MIQSISTTARKTPGIRSIYRWINQYKISRYARSEEERRISDPKNLMNFEKKIFSQNGEDGIIETIFNRLGTTDRFFVEFGIENGQQCNCRYLLEKHGWQGLWLDGSQDNVAQAQEFFTSYPIRIKQNFITRENIVDIFKENKVPQEFDLLSIDIDGNDWWVWQQLVDYRPRVVVLEYNAAYLPDEDWVMPYNPNHRFDATAYFGASLLAYNRLATEKDYALVGCDSTGVNAFFVRKDLIKSDLFPFADAGATYHYVSPKYCKTTFGWPRAPRHPLNPQQ